MCSSNNRQHGGSNVHTIPQGIEDLLVSQLRRPVTEKSLENGKTTVDPQAKEEPNQAGDAEAGGMTETPVNNNPSGSVSLPQANLGSTVGSVDPDTRYEANEFVGYMDASAARAQSVDMQYERNEAIVRIWMQLSRRAVKRSSRALFGMYPRNIRGESSRRGEADLARGGGGGSVALRRSASVKVVEVDGAPLVDTEALLGMIWLLRGVQLLLIITISDFPNSDQLILQPLY